MTRYRELVPPPELRRHVLCGWTLGPVAGDAPPVLPGSEAPPARLLATL